MKKLLLPMLLVVCILPSYAESVKLPPLEGYTAIQAMNRGALQKGHVYLLDSRPGLTRSQQSANGGILVKIYQPYPIYGYQDSFFLETNRQMTDNTILPSPICVSFNGLYSYMSVLGANRTINRFKEVSCQPYLAEIEGKPTKPQSMAERLETAQLALKSGKISPKQLKIINLLGDDYDVYLQHQAPRLSGMWIGISNMIQKAMGKNLDKQQMKGILAEDYLGYKGGIESQFPALWKQIDELPEQPTPTLNSLSFPPEVIFPPISDSKLEYNFSVLPKGFNVVPIDSRRWQQVFTTPQVGIYVDAPTVQKQIVPSSNNLAGQSSSLEYTFWLNVGTPDGKIVKTSTNELVPTLSKQSTVSCTAKTYDGKPIMPESYQESFYRFFCLSPDARNTRYFVPQPQTQSQNEAQKYQQQALKIQQEYQRQQAAQRNQANIFQGFGLLAPLLWH